MAPSGQPGSGRGDRSGGGTGWHTGSLHRGRGVSLGRWWRVLEAVGTSLAPILTTSVGLSPTFPERQLILAGGPHGSVFRWDDTGRWFRADTGSTRSVISVLALPEDFDRSGVALAGTLEDGVLRSDDGGRRWKSWNFGLLDIRVLALATSPTFEGDGTVFAATPSGVYRSTNGGRAWREAGFPTGAGPVISLALSPSFEDDGVGYAGTELGHVLVSRDHGASWDLIGGPPDAGPLNVLAVSPAFRDDRRVMVADLRSLYLSEDAGRRWSRRATFQESPLCALADPSFPERGLWWVGLSDGGVVCSEGPELDGWHPASAGLGGRLVTGLRSWSSSEGPTVFAFGPWEGVHFSSGTDHWSPMGGLPSRVVNDLEVVDDGGQPALYAALPEGVWLGRPDGWSRLAPFSARAVAASPTFDADRMMAAAAEEGGVVVSEDAGRSWRRWDVPFPGPVLDLALVRAAERPRLMAVDESREEDQVDVWHEGRQGWWRLAVPGTGRRSARLAGGEAREAVASVYGSVSGRLFRLPLLPGVEAGPEVARPLDVGAPGSSVLDWAVWREASAEVLLAATEDGVWRSLDEGESWHQFAEGLPDEPVTALAVVEDPSREPLFLAVTVGGSVWRRGVLG